MEYDRANGNTRWCDSELVELAQIKEYEAFNDTGYKSTASLPVGFKMIKVHMVYAVKNDGRHKSRLVAGGHLTDTPLTSVYSSCVSLCGIRHIAFLGELNG